MSVFSKKLSAYVYLFTATFNQKSAYVDLENSSWTKLESSSITFSFLAFWSWLAQETFFQTTTPASPPFCLKSSCKRTELQNAERQVRAVV